MSLIHSDAWQTHLTRAFGTTPIKLNINGTTLIITCFRAGPFRIGYVNFPVGLTNQDEVEACFSPECLTQIYATGVHLLRVGVSSNLAPPQDIETVVQLPETLIENLAQWSPEALPASVRYDLRCAGKAELRISKATKQHTGLIFAIYRDTIKRHRGRLRYNQRYFESLCELSSLHTEVDCYVAETRNEELAGFLVKIHNSGTAYYLHGGFVPEHQDVKPMYALINHAILTARDAGMKRFNMMVSPANQTSLIRHKEKWGGRTATMHHYEIAATNIHARLLSLILRWRNG